MFFSKALIIFVRKSIRQNLPTLSPRALYRQLLWYLHWRHATTPANGDSKMGNAEIEALYIT